MRKGRAVLVEGGLRTAEWEDKETGLYYNWHRYYDSGAGRYVRSDPKRNRIEYAYVKNNPITFLDFMGLEEGPAPNGFCEAVKRLAQKEKEDPLWIYTDIGDEKVWTNHSFECADYWMNPREAEANYYWMDKDICIDIQYFQVFYTLTKSYGIAFHWGTAKLLYAGNAFGRPVANLIFDFKWSIGPWVNSLRGSPNSNGARWGRVAGGLKDLSEFYCEYCDKCD